MIAYIIKMKVVQPLTSLRDKLILREHTPCGMLVRAVKQKQTALKKTIWSQIMEAKTQTEL
jgi:hypothetical protein